MCSIKTVISRIELGDSTRNQMILQQRSTVCMVRDDSCTGHQGPPVGSCILKNEIVLLITIS